MNAESNHALLPEGELLIRAITEEVIAYLYGPWAQAPAPVPEAHRSAEAIAGLIDHTVLRADAPRAEIERLCREAAEFRFAAVCVNPWYVPLGVDLLRDSSVKVGTVAGFPLGATFTRVKMAEAEEAIKLGAREIDVVLNVGALKSGLDEQVEADVRAVVELCHAGGAVCKVILEMCLLSHEEKVRSARMAQRAGADFVKTSTGFSGGGATFADVALLRETLGLDTGIKASGGIRTLEQLEAMVRAGATRIGTSSGVQILHEARGAKFRSP